jgi:hypothetical protein
MVLYALVTAAALWPAGETRMPVWLASFALGVAVALPPLITAVLDPMRPGGNGYATWYVAAIGTLMTITAVRLRPGFAWAGIVFLVVQTLFWSGPGALGTIGVIGSASWVGVAHILTNTLAKASRDSERFAHAEREATEWQAAQEAHLNERQFRLGQTSVMALPMLRTIRSSGGDLTDAQRAECLHLEAGIRDEIRGRRLLNDAVREQVMLARRRGAIVTLLDERARPRARPARARAARDDRRPRDRANRAGGLGGRGDRGGAAHRRRRGGHAARRRARRRGGALARDPAGVELVGRVPQTWKEGPDRASGPSQDSSQGDNPNIALTRPHIIGLLTLDDR